MTTIADQVARLLGEDGTCWETEDGREFEDLVKEYDGYTEAQTDDRTCEVHRVVFPDGSVITTAGGAWDIGYRDCWCWQGAGHTDDCPTR